MPTPSDRTPLLRDQIEQRILVLDGAMGTAIQALDLNADDFGALEGCNEHLVLTCPAAIQKIHQDSDVRHAYLEQAVALTEGGSDILFLETQQDTLNVKAALLGIDEAFAKVGRALPLVLSVSIETMGTMLAGQPIESLYVSVEHRDLFAIGLNCATGRDFMTDHLRTLAQISRFPISCFPNAGLPDEEGCYNEHPAMLAEKIDRFCAEEWINIIGGCCGTTAKHIGRIAAVAAKHAPRKPVTVRRSVVSGVETLVIDDDARPVIVGSGPMSSAAVSSRI